MADKKSVKKTVKKCASPLPKAEKSKKPETISFSQAMSEIIAGRKVHKLEWGDKNYYGFLNGEWLSLHKPDGKNYKWTVSQGDMMGNDYIVI